MTKKSHWENVYSTKNPNEVSWYQAHPEISLQMIEKAGLKPDNKIIDVGGGASTFIDHLVEKGYQNVTVLDISSQALERAKTRLGNNASQVINRGQVLKIIFALIIIL